MERKQRRCVLCGAFYRYCPNCYADSDKPKWYFIYDGEKCKKLDEVLSDHTHGKISTEDAKKVILEQELDKVDICRDMTENKKHLDEILGRDESKKAVKIKK